MEKIKKLFSQGIVIYFLCSGFTALIEFGLLFLLKKLLPETEHMLIVANTSAVVVSSLIHYVITSKFVFKVKKGFWSALVYIITFFMGLLIQNGVLWLTYNRIFSGINIVSDVNKNDMIITFICKCLSLAASFFITYFVRKFLNKKLKNKEKGENE